MWVASDAFGDTYAAYAHLKPKFAPCLDWKKTLFWRVQAPQTIQIGSGFLHKNPLNLVPHPLPKDRFLSTAIFEDDMFFLSPIS